MNARIPLQTLVYALPLLVVTFAVLMGAQSLSAATGDATGALLLGRVATGTLVLLIVDVVLLVGWLGMRALAEDRE